MVGNRVPPQVMFHKNLAHLGKTNPYGNSNEAKLLGLSEKEKGYRHLAMENPVFLYDSSQPAFDSNRTRAQIYWQDLSDYIGLSKSIEPPKYNSSSSYSSPVIHICDDKFAQLRSELVEIGTVASQWIQTYFMIHPDVIVRRRIDQDCEEMPALFKQQLTRRKVDSSYSETMCCTDILLVHSILLYESTISLEKIIETNLLLIHLQL